MTCLQEMLPSWTDGIFKASEALLYKNWYIVDQQ